MSSPAAESRQVDRWSRVQGLLPDLKAGLAGAILGISQSVPFALLAGVPPIMMVYSGTIMAFINAKLGASRFSPGGLNAGVSIIVGSSLAAYGTPMSNETMGYALALTFMVGVAQLAIWAFMLWAGDITRFVSKATTSGLLIGISSIMILTSLQGCLGLTIPSPEQWRVFNAIAAFNAVQRGEFNPYAATVAVATLSAGFVCWHLKYRHYVPVSLLIGSLTALGLNLLFGGPDVTGIQQLWSLAVGNPFSIPDFRQVSSHVTEALIYPAISIALLGLLMTSMVNRAMEPYPDARQDMFGQAAGHLLGAFLSCAPGAQSGNRTVAIIEAGGRTRWSLYFSAILMLIMVTVLSPFLTLIPLAAFSASLVLVGLRIGDIRRYRTERSTRAGSAAFWVVAIVSVVEDLTSGMLCGIAVSALLFVLRSRQELSVDIVRMDDRVEVRIAGKLFYAAHLEDELITLSQERRPIVFDLSQADLSGIESPADLRFLKQGVIRIARDEDINVLQSAGVPIAATHNTKLPEAA